ncbi:MAG: CheR family methyltransferase [Desulfobacteria bacterium]
MDPGEKKTLREIEVSLLLEGIHRRYGYDFRDYAPASLRRRISKCVADEKVRSVSGLQAKILHDPHCMERFLNTVSISVTSMFRDPELYLSFRKNAVPQLRNLPFLRVWHVGCATGEEVYSMAILLQEEGLLEKCRLYATDISGALLEQARAGIFPAERMKEYTANYQKAGGAGTFSEYYTARYDHVILKGDLKKNIVWSQHNLATDASFNEFHVILCRNVMIYFNNSLANKVHRLLLESFAPRGYLCLGARESLRFTAFEEEYEAVDEKQRVYRRKK